MKRSLLAALIAVLSITATFAQSKNLWSPIGYEQALALGEVKESFSGINESLFEIKISELKNLLSNAPKRTSGIEGVIIAIPGLEGKTEHYRVYEESNFAPELQAQYPEIRAYVGYGIEDPTAYLRMSISHKNLQTMVLKADGHSEFIEPFTTNNTVYAVFSSGTKREKGKIPFTCFQENEEPVSVDEMQLKSGMSSNNVFKTFSLALSCTAEYTAYHGGTVADALAAMNATMARVNGVYERDLAVKLEIIPNNTSIIYTNAATDPYSNANTGSGGAWSNQLQQTLNNVIGAANYDIGHLFGATGGGGFAGCIGCICNNANKGSGFTSPGQGGPEGDTFDIDYVAHEMGHQLGANHTYSVVDEGTGVNIEPGSGSTIMGYAGITGPTTDVQLHSDDYFAYVSINQIQNNLQNKTCSVNTPITNPVMTINAGPDYTIPKGTAFVLRGINTASNDDKVTYTWEQNDDASNSVTGDNSIVYPTKIIGPTFRSLPPVATPERYMPEFSSVWNNSLTNDWETVSTVGRTLNFTLTGRDNVVGGGQTRTDAMRVFVSGTAGPFTVTSQNTEGIAWFKNSSQTITWNVANTTSSPINTSHVNILLSTDNGATFSTVLASNTPNDGSEVITAPNIEAPYCRIKIEPVGNIYYALNQETFAIGVSVATSCTTYTNNNPTAIPDGGNQYSTSAITVPAAQNATISDVNISVNITHPYVEDLIVVVVSPETAGDEPVVLWQQQCGSNNNINITFDDSGSPVSCGNPTTGTFNPIGSLATFNGQSSQGTWVLGFIDPFQPDAGTLNSWSVEICSQTVQPLATDDFGLENFSIYPNPNTGNFTVAFNSASSQDVNITVHDMRGRQIFSSKYENTGLFSGNVNLTNVETGVYLVTVNDGARKEVKRIIVN